MRLVCPNCGAQYEVDDRVMPENGRDVQCSNCGHAWFQLPPSAEPEEPETPSPFDDIDDVGSDDDDDAPSERAGDSSADDGTEDSADDDDHETSSDEGVDDPDTAQGEKAARSLNDDVRNILQEEAAQEIHAREAERENIETQTDLGLEEAPKATPDIRVVEQDTSNDDASVGADDLKGRDVLPDIEEINSTLDAPEDEAEISLAADDAEGETRSGGFRRGFVLVVVLACLLAILYIFAPAIGERIPALQPALEQYIDVADRVRVALEDTMRNAISKMQGLIDKPENG
ncbi:zinc-ribbon domain-containing protein [Aliiroseovarius sp. 2305UL8-7]|uniref:zinc-ribbon domain-containing protein n=1 Tax=Aliiroseovarius conchicola TaxID=3121637 RepID=UPI003527928B